MAIKLVGMLYEWSIKKKILAITLYHNDKTKVNRIHVYLNKDVSKLLKNLFPRQRSNAKPLKIENFKIKYITEDGKVVPENDYIKTGKKIKSILKNHPELVIHISFRNIKYPYIKNEFYLLNREKWKNITKIYNFFDDMKQPSKKIRGDIFSILAKI